MPREQHVTAEDERKSDGGYSDRLWVKHVPLGAGELYGYLLAGLGPDSPLPLRLRLPFRDTSGAPACQSVLSGCSCTLKRCPLVSRGSPNPDPTGSALPGLRRGQSPGLSDVWGAHMLRPQGHPLQAVLSDGGRRLDNPPLPGSEGQWEEPEAWWLHPAGPDRTQRGLAPSADGPQQPRSPIPR